MSTVADYQGRTVDLLLYQGIQPTGDVQLQQTLAMDGEGGRVCTGVQKLAQRVIVELFRETGSTKFWPDEGTSFLLEARSGEFRTVADVMGAFSRAAVQIIETLQADEVDSDPDDERIESLEVQNVVLEQGRVVIYARLLSVAGEDRSYIFPIPVSVGAKS